MEIANHFIYHFLYLYKFQVHYFQMYFKFKLAYILSYFKTWQILRHLITSIITLVAKCTEYSSRPFNQCSNILPS